MINLEETKYMMKQLREDNEKALEIYKDSLDKVAFTTSIFINYILDDIEFIENIEPKAKNIRYIYSKLGRERNYIEITLSKWQKILKM